MNMSAARHSAITKYVTTLANLMNLSHYDISVSKSYDNIVRGAEVFASMEVRPDADAGTLFVSQNFFDKYNAPVQRVTLVHELIHLHVDALWSFIYQSGVLKEILGLPAYSILEEASRSAMERMVDQIAYGWAISLPLPNRFPK